MARLNDDGQWIILMAFIISIGIFFIAILLNQSVLVGQTTAEAVLEFPKADIQDLRNEVWVIFIRNESNIDEIIEDIKGISLSRKAAVVDIESNTTGPWKIHYNNGITRYSEEIQYVSDPYPYYYFHY